ncbi:hypothetical protein JAAARDRAFT_36799 [Jaapia argillacea MUCL 33604]|uniref:GATA-type domain-containing protein n=1 Tax=Jaapia argillacea MUCL 33604 TaxID=933084 RepID=A0A067PXL0_9AGAM|nr:hypothetical protein JAAARDRAFT_36799 [Jaapia argillacea MUCL 33604]
MPSILNLKFKGNKSFVAFSNLSDADALTKTWKVCTKVASFLEQGQRLENLSWRLWHLQNLMVDSDNAKSKREFRKLSKHMGDKLDKEKGRSIEELEAPGFKRNQSTDLIQQRAVEKERQREACQNASGGIQRMQFTFSVDNPSGFSTTSVKKPDLKPSAEFKDTTIGKRQRPSTRAPNQDDYTDKDAMVVDNDKDAPRGRASAKRDAFNDNEISSPALLRFPSLFSNDFGPSALLYPSPTLTNSMNYGEDVSFNPNHNSSTDFSITRPTIELPLDELLNHVESSDSPGPWSSLELRSTDAPRNSSNQHDVMMRNASDTPNAFLSRNIIKHDDHDTIMTSANNHPLGLPLTPQQLLRDSVPQTVVPSKVGPNSGSVEVQMNNAQSSSARPSLTIKTQATPVTRSSGPSATATSPAQLKNNNSAPGGVKAECSNCGATHTPLWRRGLNDELNCNACGLYCKLHKRPRPKGMRNNHGEGRSQATPRQDTQEVIAQCYNCHTTATPLWRKDDEGKTVCNACGLYYKLHGSARPISMKSDVIRKRSRHDARRVGGPADTPPSASPGASRRASPSAEPTLAPDSTTQISYGEYEYQPPSQSELMGALGPDNNQSVTYNSQGSYHAINYNTFPGPYHPDYLMKNYGNLSADQLPNFGSGDTSDSESTGTESRSSKRRRMSTDSATEPPSSATSYSSFTDGFGSSQSGSPLPFQRSVDFPYNSYASFGFLRGSSSAFWHPPMLPPGDSPQMFHPPMLPPDHSPQFIHPPMLPPEESPMDYLHPPMLPQDDDLFNTYLHPPMLLPDGDSNGMGSHHTHPPMLPNDWSNNDFYHGNNVNHRSGNDNGLQAY